MKPLVPVWPQHGTATAVIGALSALLFTMLVGSLIVEGLNLSGTSNHSDDIGTAIFGGLSLLALPLTRASPRWMIFILAFAWGSFALACAFVFAWWAALPLAFLLGLLALAPTSPSLRVAATIPALGLAVIVGAEAALFSLPAIVVLGYSYLGLWAWTETSPRALRISWLATLLWGLGGVTLAAVGASRNADPGDIVVAAFFVVLFLAALFRMLLITGAIGRLRNQPG